MRKTYRKLKLLLVVLVMAIFTGCGTNNIQQAESALNGMFLRMKHSDADGIQQLIGANTLYELIIDNKMQLDYNSFMKSLVKRADYKMLSAKKIGIGKVCIKAEITSVDMKEVINDYIHLAKASIAGAQMTKTKPMSQTIKNWNDTFTQCILRDDQNKIVTMVNILVQKKGDSWEVIPDYTLAYTITGGAVDVMEEFAAFRDAAAAVK